VTGGSERVASHYELETMWFCKGLWLWLAHYINIGHCPLPEVYLIYMMCWELAVLLLQAMGYHFTDSSVITFCTSGKG